MAQISRLKDAEISNGETIDADDLDAEFNQLITAHNTNDTELTAIGTGTYSFSGVKTFTSSPKTNGIDERTSAAGVTVDGVLLKDGAITLASTAGYTPATNGDFGYDSTAHAYEGRINGNNVTFYHSGNLSLSSVWPKGYIGGAAPVWAAVTGITLKAGTRARNSADTDNIELTGDVTLSLATSGAAGLDTGSEASNTWYYVYLIRKSSDGTCSAVFSTTNEAVSGSITYPSGYDQKRQLPIAVRNDGSSNVMDFTVANGWPYRPLILYNTEFPESRTSSTKSTEVLDQGTSTTFAGVSCSSYIPAIAQLGYFYVLKATSGTIGYIRPTGSSFTNGNPVEGYDESTYRLFCKTNSSQSIDYKVSSSAIDIHVLGYVVTEIA